MPVSYAVKRFFRSWNIFLALLISLTLASAFFAGIDIKANATALQALDQQLGNVYVDMQASFASLNSTEMLAKRESVLNLEGVLDAEVISRVYGVSVEIFGKNDSLTIFSNEVSAITNNSHVYGGWLNKPSGKISANEIYILEGTNLAKLVEIGTIIQVNFSMSFYDEKSITSMNFTVAGFAQLDETALAIAYGYTYWPMPFDYSSGTNYMLINWEENMREILEIMQEQDVRYSTIETNLLIYLNRKLLINPWDIETSIKNVEVVKNSIINTAGLTNVQNNLEWPLRSFQFISIGLRFGFTIISLPIFFVAWYVGRTVSDVSFNLRRREIGLLSTKGFSRGQILRTFLTETLLIGYVGGLLGVFLGVLLIPFFTQFSTDTLFDLRLISPYTLIFTIIFSLTLAFLSTYSSAKKASQLVTVEALREYLPMESEMLRKKRWPLLALILGTYKIGVFLLGVNMTTLLSRILFAGGNFLLGLLVGVFMILDFILNYIGPLLFFWGFTKLFIQGSLEFQTLTAKIAKFLGDLGVLATKNVRRNPARAAAIAFLIALIVGYSVQVNGQLASERDYAVRQIYYRVGADVTVNFAYESNASEFLSAIIANVSSYIENVTIEHSFSAYTPGYYYSMQIRAIEPRSWLKAAYYESEWFSGNPIAVAFDNLASDKNTIILDINVAKSLNCKIGGNVSLTFGSITKQLRIVGFFGTEIQQTFQILQYVTYGYGSFISESLYEEINMHVSAYSKVFLKLKSGVSGKNVAESIRNLNLGISSVVSFAEEWEKTQTNILVMGTLDVQRLGIIFAFLSASVGTALVSAVSMRERAREATIMSVKGLSYKQLIIMFLTENLALVTFSVFLGLFVGFVALYGNISANNAMVSDIVKRRLIFPLDTALIQFSCLALIFASTILPILIMARKYVTKLERIVRLR